MKKHKLKWYIPETNTYIYDDEVIKLLTPKLDESIKTLSSIQELIDTSKQNLNSSLLTSKYLEYEELLSQIQTILECHFNNH